MFAIADAIKCDAAVITDVVVVVVTIDDVEKLDAVAEKTDAIVLD